MSNFAKEIEAVIVSKVEHKTVGSLRFPGVYTLQASYAKAALELEELFKKKLSHGSSKPSLSDD